MAQAPRPRRATSKTSKLSAKKPTTRPVAKRTLPAKTPSHSKDWGKIFSNLRMNSAVRIVVLLAIVGGIFILNPQSGIIPTSGSNPSTTETHKIDIRSRALSDPHQGDLKIKTGSKAILDVTTDEDGRLDLVSSSRDVFNPIFSNVSNTLSIPTDQPESFRLEFHPAGGSTTSPSGITIGTVIIQN